jgi:prepilin-type N-terminal cleavage/methylation domain-containing protein
MLTLNPMRQINHPKAFTLVELAVVIAVLAILAASLLPVLGAAKPAALRLVCGNNLRQVAVAFQTWGNSHNGNMPMKTTGAQGGNSEDVGIRTLGTSQGTSRGVSKIFLCMSNELVTPKILFCPAEYEINYRQFASSFSATGNDVLYTNDLNVSYFIGVDASEFSPRMCFAGDHNIGGDNNPPTTAYCAAPSTYKPSFAVWLGTDWSANMGPAFMANQHFAQGNVALADGSVDCFSQPRFQDVLRHTGDYGRDPGTFRPATGALAGPGYNRIQLP